MKFENELLEIDFLTISDNTKYWFVRAGQRAEFYDDFRINNFISIGHNSVDLETLNSIDNKFKTSLDILKDRYKIIFNNTYTDKLKKTDDFKKMETNEQEKEIEKTRRSSTIAANKTFSFIEEMDIGDYVFVPNKGTSSFLIGMVISDVTTTDINHKFLDKENEYVFSNYIKKRRVAWIKTLPVNELPEKLLWIQNAHKAIFDITNNANDINPLLSNEYIYKGKAHLKINVESQKSINSTTWLQYQILVNKAAGNRANELYQKPNVQSPGQIIIETVINNWEIIVVTGAVLFGEVDLDIMNVKFKTHGPLSFLVPGAKKRKERQQLKDDLDLKKQNEEVNGLVLDNKLKELNIQKEELSINKILIEQTELTNSSERLVPINRNQIVSPTLEEQTAIHDMQLSQRTSGSDISPETQRENLNQVIYESE